MAKRIQQKPRKQRSLRGMARRGLSILMAMVMVISLIQISVFATGGDESLPVGEYHLISRNDFWNYCETTAAEKVENGHWVSALVISNITIEAKDGRETWRPADLTGGIDGYNVYADAKDGSGDIQPSEIAYVVLYGTYLDCYTWGIFDLPWADIISFEYKIPITEFNVQSYPDQWDTQAYAEITFKDSSETPDPETEYSATLNFTYGYEDETAQAVPQEAMTGFQLNDGQAVIAYPKSKIDTTWTNNGDGTYSKTLDIPDTITVNGVEYALEEGTSKTVTISETGTTQNFYYSAQQPIIPDPEYDLPVKYYVLNPKQGVPENGDDQGYLNYFPFATAEENKDFNYANGMSGTGLSNATWTALAGDGTLKIDDTLTNMDGFSAGQVGQLDSKSIAALEDAFGLTSNTYEIVWYAVKCQAAQGTSGVDDAGQAADIHVDGYIKDVTVDVRYHANFGDASPEVYSDDAVTGEVYSVLGYEATKLPDRDKYEFVGWNTQPNGKGTSYPANSKIDPVMGAVDLYAQWESEETPGEKTFSVNFQYVTDVANASQVPSGVSLPAALTAKVGETITFGQQSYGTGTIPSGYTFSGWYSDAACSTEVTEDQTFAANATVYGYWTYTGGGNPGGGDTYYTLTVKYLEEGTDEELAPAYTQSIAAGRSYDVTAQTEKVIDGYEISDVTGDKVTGFMNGDREIIVYYTVYIDDGETPLNPGPGGDGSGDGDTDIGDIEVPLDPGTGNNGDGTDIGDENVPLVPATGDNLALWVLAAVVSAAGLVYLTVTGKKREQENG